MIVVVCPGQGSQTPGFLAPWLAEPSFADRLSALSEAAGADLTRHGTESDADTIRDTAIAQPLIVAAGILAFDALAAEGRRAAIGAIGAGASVSPATPGSGVAPGAGQGAGVVPTAHSWAQLAR